MSKAEKLLEAWVNINNIIKNPRMTKELSYNEAIIMLMLYKKYLKDKESLTSLKEIIENTGMLKSLVNRTINSLEEKGLCERVENKFDKRSVYLKCIEKNLDIFLKVHFNSISVSQKVIDIIGEDDASNFIRIVEKIISNKNQLI